ncbi:MAG: hypothetical protein IJW16_02310, partial [Clostridia bacterium]|nr:hypothetical protein [Clostridia bacterium]
EYGELAPCSGGTATCTQRAICSTCGEEYGELADHSYTIINGYKGADGHANTCVCGAHGTPVAHNPDRAEATVDNPILCTVCNYTIAPKHTHDHGTAWESDASEHWNECACGDKANKAAHTDSNNDGKCDVCAYQMASNTPGGNTPGGNTPGGNTPGGDGGNNAGSTPDPNSPAPTPTDDEGGLGVGAIVGIVCGSVAVVGIGGVAIFWFAIKKKSWADLIAVFKKK